MCGLFGYYKVGKPNGKAKINFKGLINGLSLAAQVRGTHATGIAYPIENGVAILKAAKAARDFKLSFKNDSFPSAIMGHTRHTTKGNQADNYNNHPFPGRANDISFALAHNGVLDNDIELQFSEKLPKTEIKTDSYVAVQLLEKYGYTAEGVKRMAETVEGMFTFTIIDQIGTLTFVKNDSPLHLIYIAKLKLYVYGSTPEIVNAGLKTAGLIGQKFELIKAVPGDIISISKDGILARQTFKPTERYYNYYNNSAAKRAANGNTTFRYANDFGIEEELYHWGFSEEEVELLKDNYSEVKLWDLMSKGDIEEALFELLRFEYTVLKKELNKRDREFGRWLLDAEEARLRNSLLPAPASD